MRRRAFVAGLGCTIAFPLPVRAQQSGLPVIGFLRSTGPASIENLVRAFRQGLEEAGFVEGQNVLVEYRYADNQLDRLPALADELIQRPASVIVGDTLPAIALKERTTSVPIVFATGNDPVAAGLVASLNQPGGNVTGVVFFGTSLGAKRLELLRQVAPKATTIAMLVNRSNPNAEVERQDVQAAAQTMGQPLVILEANSTSDIDAAFGTFAQRGAGAVLSGAGAFMNANRKQIAALAASYGLPSMFVVREAALDGGLVAYGPSVPDAYRQVGIYAGRILKGATPANLPVIRSTKFEFVINLKTARTLGLDLPQLLLAQADEVIE
jgi:putative ABC transport system substrate-binding protein